MNTINNRIMKVINESINLIISSLAHTQKYH